MTMMMDVQPVTYEAIDADHLAELISEKTHLPAELGVRLAKAVLSRGSVRFHLTETVALAEVDGEHWPAFDGAECRVIWTAEVTQLGRHAHYWLTREAAGTETTQEQQ